MNPCCGSALISGALHYGFRTVASEPLRQTQGTYHHSTGAYPCVWPLTY